MIERTANERGEVEAFLSKHHLGSQLLDAIVQANLNLNSISLQDLKDMYQSLRPRLQKQRSFAAIVPGQAQL